MAAAAAGSRKDMTTTQPEREAKFEGAGQFDPQDLCTLPAVARVREEAPEELDAVYYDTADLRLLLDGVTLRHGSGGTDTGWRVELPQETRHMAVPGKAGDVPGELRRRTAVFTRGRDVVPVAHLRTHRRRHVLLDENGRELAELTQDTVAAQTLDGEPAGAAPLHAGGQEGTCTRITQWSEIDVELADGGPELLRAARKQLAAAGWRPSGSAHKLQHALTEELRAVEAGSAPAGDDRRLRPGSAGAAVMDRLARQTTALVQADPGTRFDEPDALHRMRSAARRLRSLLRGQRKVLDRRRTDPVVRELHWLTGLLAAPRDHEVLAERLPAQARRLERRAPELRPALRGLAERIGEQERARHDPAWQAAVEALDSPRYFALLDALDALLADPPLRPAAAKPAAKQLRKAAEHDRRRLLKRIAAVENAPEGPARERALHGVRKAARRARHTAETARPVTGKPARRLLKRTKALQKLLGEHQDAVVARGALLSLSAAAHRSGADTFGYGLLHAEQEAAIADLQQHFPKAARRAVKRGVSRLH
ncbi:CHAD domain-containing protein [Actinacidiphila guanduensis]|uniref:CHAD domain-containing protein n=2 Tax=Actinacidiphila guanduensis TaxID=310781 RepID=A0A1H0BNR2_9ACTN|nr:CHAD domain-containing protein [Actinacidiphila guanduensis]